MVQNALETISKLGIEASLARRFASLIDLNPQNLIWHKNVSVDPNTTAVCKYDQARFN
jgi:hypothetical protein